MRNLMHAAVCALQGRWRAIGNLEVTTVEDDAVTFHPVNRSRAPRKSVRVEGLKPGKRYRLQGRWFRTLSRPDGELLTKFAAVNDLHFGEQECGLIEGFSLGAPVRSEGQSYPDLMNRSAVCEILDLKPSAVIAKGDLTDSGKRTELEKFEMVYGVFGANLHRIPGNHDFSKRSELTLDDFSELPRAVELSGATIALLDTTIPGAAGGRLGRTQLAWLEKLATESAQPIIVFGHHPPARRTWLRFFPNFRLDRRDTKALIDVVRRNNKIVAYIAGHTHRNRVQHRSPTGAFPWIEVGSVKEWPGNWAEYRIYEGGVQQIVHRISAPAALEWSDRTRKQMYPRLHGLYATVAAGLLGDRCTVIPFRHQPEGAQTRRD